MFSHWELSLEESKTSNHGRHFSLLFPSVNTQIYPGDRSVIKKDHQSRWRGWHKINRLKKLWRSARRIKWVFELRAGETTGLENGQRMGLVVLLPMENVGMQVWDQRELPK